MLDLEERDGEACYTVTVCRVRGRVLEFGTVKFAVYYGITVRVDAGEARVESTAHGGERATAVESEQNATGRDRAALLLL